MEVIYTGLRQTPEMIVEATVQEDVDVLGISTLSGAHMALVPRILRLLQEQGRSDIPVFLGGIIPTEDGERLQAMGVTRVFGPGTDTQEVVAFLRELVKR
jgi:methylmalonyl-CoA mutase C-terminal domain/subunit